MSNIDEAMAAKYPRTPYIFASDFSVGQRVLINMIPGSKSKMVSARHLMRRDREGVVIKVGSFLTVRTDRKGIVYKLAPNHVEVIDARL